MSTFILCGMQQKKFDGCINNLSKKRIGKHLTHSQYLNMALYWPCFHVKVNNIFLVFFLNVDLLVEKCRRQIVFTVYISKRAVKHFQNIIYLLFLKIDVIERHWFVGRFDINRTFKWIAFRIRRYHSTNQLICTVHIVLQHLAFIRTHNHCNFS